MDRKTDITFFSIVFIPFLVHSHIISDLNHTVYYLTLVVKPLWLRRFINTYNFGLQNRNPGFSETDTI